MTAEGKLPSCLTTSVLRQALCHFPCTRRWKVRTRCPPLAPTTLPNTWNLRPVFSFLDVPADCAPAVLTFRTILGADSRVVLPLVVLDEAPERALPAAGPGAPAAPAGCVPG